MPPLKRVLLLRTVEMNDSHLLKFQGSNEASLSVLLWFLLHVSTHTVSTLKLSKLQNRNSASCYPTPLNEKKKTTPLTNPANQPPFTQPPPAHRLFNLPRHQSIKTPIPKKRRRHSAIPAFQSSSPNSSLLSFSSYLYLPCKPTKTKNPQARGRGK